MGLIGVQLGANLYLAITCELRFKIQVQSSSSVLVALSLNALLWVLLVPLSHL